MKAPHAHSRILSMQWHEAPAAEPMPSFSLQRGGRLRASLTCIARPCMAASVGRARRGHAADLRMPVRWGACPGDRRPAMAPPPPCLPDARPEHWNMHSWQARRHECADSVVRLQPRPDLAARQTRADRTRARRREMTAPQTREPAQRYPQFSWWEYPPLTLIDTGLTNTISDGLHQTPEISLHCAGRKASEP